jgi:hypothetical protein
MNAKNIKNVPQVLNLDDDVRYLQPTDTTYALNVRSVTSDSNNAGVIQSIESNTKVANELPAGTNKCIGTIEHIENNDLYYFNWNSAGNHGIYRYNSITRKITKILVNSLLKFSKQALITGGFALKFGDDNALLYWTDNLNQPRKINVNKAIYHTQGNYNEGYPNPLTEEYILLVKYPPTDAPSWEYFEDSTIPYNNLDRKLFQFAALYVYDDGEQSAMSPISVITTSPKQLENSAVNELGYNTYNLIKVTVPKGSAICSKIKILAREGNDGEWKFIQEVSNPKSASSVTIDFYNDGNYSVFDPVITNKLFDNVPLRSGAMELMANRTMLADYVEGYDRVSDIIDMNGVDKQNTKIFLTPTYKSAPNMEATKLGVYGFGRIGGANTISTLNASGNWNAGFTISEMPSSFIVDLGTLPTVGGLYVLNFSVSLWHDFSSEGDANRIAVENLLFSQVEAVLPGQTKQDFVNEFVAKLNGRRIGSYSYKSQTRPLVSGNYRARITAKPFASNPTGAIEIGFEPERTSDLHKLGFYKIFKIGDNAYSYNGGVFSSTFKAGAEHTFGIVYYDKANRSSTVHTFKKNNPYVKWYNERPTDFIRGGRLAGPSDMDWVIQTQPPTWATHYQWVYQGNNTASEFLQYTCTRAYKAQNPDYLAKEVDRRVYLGFRSFQGNPDSYKEQYGALLDYNYQSGDRLRIKSYYDPVAGERVTPSEVTDFKIVGLELYGTDETNPVYSTTSKFETKGWFLIIEDPKIREWDSINGTSPSTGFWYNDAARESAIFEIYRPKGTEDDRVFYEFGERYEIGDAGLPTRYHKGGVRNQNELITYPVTEFNVAEKYITVTGVNVKLVAGDSMVLRSGVTGKAFVNIAYLEQYTATETRVYLNDIIVVSAGSVDSLLLMNYGAAGTFQNGDCWFKPRIFRFGSSASAIDIRPEYVEDYYANDFFKSNSSSKGRPNAYSETSKQEHRYASITYSQPFFTDTNLNGLSSFNLNLGNYRRVDHSFGTIKKLKKDGFNLHFVQQFKMGYIPVDRRVIESADGQQTLTLSTEILGKDGTETYYQGDYGMSDNPESFQDMDGTFYNLDIKKAKVLRKGGDGLTPISDYKVSSFWDAKAKEILKISDKIKFIGGIDRENKEYIITQLPYSSGAITVDDGEGGGGNPSDDDYIDITADEDNIRIPLKFNLLTADESRRVSANAIENECRPIEEIDDLVEEWGCSRVRATEFARSGVFSFHEDSGHVVAEVIPTTIELTTASDTVIVSGEYNISEGELVIPREQVDVDLDVPEVINVAGFTLAFSEEANRWPSFYSYIPEMYGKINYDFISFKDGELYIHNEATSYNSFYDTQYTSKITFNWNLEPSRVKTFHAMMLESNTPWSVLSIKTDLNSTAFAKEFFKRKESYWHTHIPMATTNSTRNILMGDVITGIDGNTLTFNWFNINHVGGTVGDTIHKQDGTLVGTITAFNPDTEITLNTIGDLQIGDYVRLEKPSIIDGDLVRGYYAEVQMENDSDGYVELFGVTAKVNLSRLHS